MCATADSQCLEYLGCITLHWDSLSKPNGWNKSDRRSSLSSQFIQHDTICFSTTKLEAVFWFKKAAKSQKVLQVAFALEIKKNYITVIRSESKKSSVSGLFVMGRVYLLLVNPSTNKPLMLDFVSVTGKT